MLGLSALTAAAMSLTAGAKSDKRGVSESAFQVKAQMEAIAPGVSWFYNWGPSIGGKVADQDFLEFVPMCWNGSFDADKIRKYVAEHPGTRYLLGFNEPNFTNQANMTPEAAAAKWPEVQALAAELGLGLVAPAMNYSPNPPYQSPTKWFDEFVALVGRDAFDYLAVHAYGGFGVMSELATTFHERYGKPVWVTEFCYWPGESKNTYVSPETQIGNMIKSVQWLEKTEWIHRYAWFMATGKSSADTGPNYGLLISGKGEEPRQLSNQGLVYVNMTDFDPDVYNLPNMEIPVQNFINQDGLLMTGNEDKGNSFPLEISGFSGGAFVDYQFELTGESATALNLRVGGVGEPVRFDPTVSVCLVNEDGSEGDELCAPTKFALPGAGNGFYFVSLPLSLAPGRHTIRIKDADPSRPSGLLISAIALMTPSSVGEIPSVSDSRCDVWTPAGVCVRRGADAAAPLSGLPAGVYIVNGKKILKH